MSKPMTTTDLQGTIARVAVCLDQARGLLIRARTESPREWPEEMKNQEVPPSLEHLIHTDVGMLLETFVEPGLALAQATSRLTHSGITREWQADRAAALFQDTSALFAPEGNHGDYPVPDFLEEVEAVMNAAHALRGKKGLTGAERAVVSRAIRLRMALLGEENLESYIVRALSDRLPPALDDEAEDLLPIIRQALTSLSQAALGFTAMLRRASALAMETGLRPEEMTAITDRIEELDRQLSALLDSPEDA